tara:strand:+ start:1079 stop:1738 length:660 start_codon:yes stop_codon:yes gene_type:complete
MSANKKTSRFDKIRASQICGEGLTISGNNLVISGHKGYFHELEVDDINSAPHLIYAFRFGGPVAHVPTGDPQGLVAGTTSINVDNSGIFATGDHVIINPTDNNYHQEQHTITGIFSSNPYLSSPAGTLHVEDSLAYSYTTGTLIANKFATTGTSSDRCSSSTCYDTKNLYLEYGKPEDIMWKASGYREWFIEESGIKINITGAPNSIIESGLLTFIYPD